MPYITAYQHIKSFAPNMNGISFFPIILVSIINIGFFNNNMLLSDSTTSFCKKISQKSIGGLLIYTFPSLVAEAFFNCRR